MHVPSFPSCREQTCPAPLPGLFLIVVPSRPGTGDRLFSVARFHALIPVAALRGDNDAPHRDNSACLPCSRQ